MALLDGMVAWLRLPIWQRSINRNWCLQIRNDHVKTEIGFRKIEMTGPLYRITIGDSESLMVKTNTPVRIPLSPIRSTESRC